MFHPRSFGVGVETCLTLPADHDTNYAERSDELVCTKATTGPAALDGFPE